jgi:hypothetical protein
LPQSMRAISVVRESKITNPLTGASFREQHPIPSWRRSNAP